MCFSNVNTGFVAGDDQYSYLIYKTNNGGMNWDLLLSYPIYHGSLFTKLFAITFASTNVGYAFGSVETKDSLVMLKTFNGGSNWNFQKFHADYLILEDGSSFFTNDNTGYLANYQNIYKTTNGGLSWLSQYYDNMNSVESIYFTSASVGYVASLKGILYTRNGGSQWQIQDNHTFLNSIHFVDLMTGWAVGGGTILKTTNGGLPIGIQPISAEIPKEFSLSQNYPNPFNPVTKIKFALPKTSNVKLSIFDVTGKEIDIPVSEELNAGIYEIDWDAANYSSGVYFYRLEAGEFVESKRMVLIK